MPKYAPHTSSDAIRRAKGWVGKSYPAGWCQRWVVADIFGTGGVGDFDGDGAADAEDGWKAAVMRGKVVHAHDIASYDGIPAGVAMYWTGGRNDHGHAAVSAGNGFIYSTDLPTSGRIGKVTIDQPHIRWGLTFAGYVLVTGNGYTLNDKPTGPVDKMDPANYGPGKSGPHILWYGQRLEAHGFGDNYTPTEDWGPADKRKTAEFQRAQGWAGSAADGLPGRETLRRLAADPKPHPKPVLNTRQWKATLPEGKPTEHYPVVDDSPYCTNEGDHWRFKVPVTGATTSGSKYPRSELREMTTSGKKAAWSNRVGRHLLTGRSSVTHLPGKKPEAVIAQVHDADDDVVMILVSGTNVYLSESLGKGKGSRRHLLVGNYRVGQMLAWSIDATPTGIRTTVNGKRADVKRIVTGAYFKAGCYCQANEDNGTGYAEVAVYELEVTHT